EVVNGAAAEVRCGGDRNAGRIPRQGAALNHDSGTRKDATTLVVGGVPGEGTVLQGHQAPVVDAASLAAGVVSAQLAGLGGRHRAAGTVVDASAEFGLVVRQGTCLYRQHGVGIVVDTTPKTGGVSRQHTVLHCQRAAVKDGAALGVDTEVLRVSDGDTANCDGDAGAGVEGGYGMLAADGDDTGAGAIDRQALRDGNDA